MLTLTLYASRRGNLNGRSRTQAATLRPARDHQRTRVDAHQRARHSWLRAHGGNAGNSSQRSSLAATCKAGSSFSSIQNPPTLLGDIFIRLKR